MNITTLLKGVIMPLTPEQNQKVQDWFKNKIPDYSCTICKSKEVQPVEMVGSPTVEVQSAPFDPNSPASASYYFTKVTNERPTIPMIQIVCNNCGNVTHFVALGIII